MDREAPDTPLRTVEDAARYLEGLINRERIPERSRGRIGLGPIRQLLERLGHPESGLSVVHVAGSKGKGSVCLLAEAVLRELGERTGTFTSPHLERWTERFRIDGAEIDGALLADAVRRLRPHVDRLRAEVPDDAPSFFDATTAAALLVFAGAGLDRVLLEVGIGGRLDSTNAVTPAVTCITTIELEHTAVLGGTLEAIAGEKAGILKPGVPAVVGLLAPAALGVVKARAAEVGAPLRVEGQDFASGWKAHGSLGGALRYSDWGGLELEVELPLLGAHQARNAGLALASLRQLGAHSADDLATAAQRALSVAALPGRIEVVSRDPWVVIDGAHTAASARALAEALDLAPRGERHLVLSVSGDKALAGILGALAPGTARITVTCANPLRSLAPQDVAEAIRETPGCAELDVRIVPDPARAVRGVLAAQQPDELVCITGSVYLAGIARGILREAGRTSALPSRGAT